MRTWDLMLGLGAMLCLLGLSLVLRRVAMSLAIPTVCCVLVTDFSGLLAVTSLFTSR